MNTDILIAFTVYLLLRWYSNIFLQTLFHHRYWSHGMFRMSKGWENVFYFLSFLFQGASYFPVRTYILMHRLHHAHSDEARDPHSPRHHDNSLEMGWNMRRKFRFLDHYHPDLTDEEVQHLAAKYLRGKSLAWLNNLQRVDPKFFKDLPVKTCFDTFASSMTMAIFWGLGYASLYACLGYYLAVNDVHPAYWLLLALWPADFFLGGIQGTIVNWFGHKLGYQNFGNGDDSRNTLPWDILLCGELYQNNHHANPHRAKFSVKWFEIDPMYPFIWLFNWLGIIQLKKI